MASFRPHRLLDRDQFLALFVWGAAALVTGSFIWLLSDMVWHGAAQLSWDFLTADTENAGRAGGIGPILASTLLILAVVMTVAAPIGLATAILLNEFIAKDNRLARAIGMSIDVLAGVPSIVFGLFGMAFFSVYLGLGFSILAGGLTLACMALPILIRTIEEGLSAVPDEWRLGAAALGMSKLSALLHILLPAAAPALAAGLMLGIGRAMAETAALIFTSGYVDRMPSSLHDSGRALAVHIYDLSMNVAGGDTNAYASALVLVILLIIINNVALWLAHSLLQKRISSS
ncbi:MAG: phosphate ABC transporter permease PstA [Methylotenera sp.]|nr:phosphate ABC transporter permease PstA [Methylotenera sp.]MDD4927045.1 phosphate ABC transporter permease PstA [Methylotenera sp.]